MGSDVAKVIASAKGEPDLTLFNRGYRKMMIRTVDTDVVVLSIATVQN